MLTTVASFREPWEAHMFRSRLAAEGVPAVLIHEYHIGNAWHYSTALGSVRVQVPAERKEDAELCGLALQSRRVSQNARKSIRRDGRDSLSQLRIGRLSKKAAHPARSNFPCGFVSDRRYLPTGRVDLYLLPLRSEISPDLGASHLYKSCNNPDGECLGLCRSIGGGFVFWSISTKYWFVTVLIEVMLVGLWKRLRTGNTPVD